MKITWMFLFVVFSQLLHAALWDEHLELHSKRNGTPGKLEMEDLYSESQRAFLEKLLKDKAKKVRIASYNVLFNILDEKLPEQQKWKSRLPRMVKTIKTLDPDILGLQESQSDQIEDLKRELGATYEFLTIESALQKIDPKNHFADAVLFRKERFKVVGEKFLYNSKTPLQPTSDPKASYPTINHVVSFHDQVANKNFTVVNCHLYFFSADIREISIDAIGTTLAKEKDPVFIIGDFNLMTPRLEMDPPFLDGFQMHRQFRKFGYEDSYDMALLGHVGPTSTFTNSLEKPRDPFTGTGIPGNRLDRIYISPGINILLHGIYAPDISPAEFASDHFPVAVDALLSRETTFP